MSNSLTQVVCTIPDDVQNYIDNYVDMINTRVKVELENFKFHGYIHQAKSISKYNLLGRLTGFRKNQFLSTFLKRKNTNVSLFASKEN